MDPAALFAGGGEHFAQRRPEAQRPVADRNLGSARQPSPLEILEHFDPREFALAEPVMDGQQPLAPIGRRPDHDQEALALVIETHVAVDPVGPEVNVSIAREIAPAPRFILPAPDFFHAHDAGRRKARRILAE